jgi:O-antigen ligase
MPARLNWAQASLKTAEASWLLLLVLLPAVFNPAGALSVEPVKASLFRCLAAVIAVSWLASRLLRAEAPAAIGANPVVRAGLVVLGAATLSTITSLSPETSFFGTYLRGMGWLNLAAGAAVLITGADLLADRCRRERALTALLLGAVFPCAYALSQQLGRDPFQWTHLDGPVSSLGSPTFLGGYLVLVVPFALYRAVIAGQAVANSAAPFAVAKYMLSVALVLLVAMVVAQTGIRGPLVGLAAGVVTFAVLATWHSHARLRRAAYVAAAGFFVATLALSFLIGGGEGVRVLGRLTEIADPSGSGNERLRVWSGAAILPMREPLRALLGFGPEMQSAIFEQSEAIVRSSPHERWDRAHNLVVDTWVTGGALGLLGLGAALYVVVRSAWRVHQRREPQSALLAAAVLAALAGHLAEQLFAFHTVVTGALFWVLLACAASLAQPSGLSRRVTTLVPGRRRALLAAGFACVLVLPGLGAPAQADALHGAALGAERRGALQEAAKDAEAATAWAPWVEDLPRTAARSWQTLGFRRGGAEGEALLGHAETLLIEAARRGAGDPYAHARLARHYVAWAKRGALTRGRDELLALGERACARALETGPFRPTAWEACAEVSAARGNTDLAAARAAEAAWLARPARDTAV